MQNSKAFYDLCIPYTENHKELYRILDELYDCKYIYLRLFVIVFIFYSFF